MGIETQSVDVALFDMVMSLSRALDLLHPAIGEHHLRVAYLCASIAEHAGFRSNEIQEIIIAGALHDIVAVCKPHSHSLLERVLSRNDDDMADGECIHEHAEEGYHVLREFPPFAQAAAIIRFHHVDWNFGKGEFQGRLPIPLASHILRLADRLAVLPTDDCLILCQKDHIRQSIQAGTGSLFCPELVKIFEDISVKESFWLDLVSKHKEKILSRRFFGETSIRLRMDSLYGLAKVYARIIDYRSAYTASHSSRVASASELLADRLGLPAHTVRLVGIAGYLHDIGKLAVPVALLDKPGKLTAEEMLLIRQHPYYTHQILSPVPGLETIGMWAAFHHERLDGAGYPFRPRHIPLEARIVAVADVFTAITEDRPYRTGMSREDSLGILNKMVSEGALDGDIVSLLPAIYEDIHHAQELALA